MNNLLNLIGVPPFLREAFKGIIVIGAVLLQKKEKRERKGGRRRHVSYRYHWLRQDCAGSSHSRICRQPRRAAHRVLRPECGARAGAGGAYGGKAYASVEALLADPTVDAVSVCSANASHAQIAVAALEAGKHVLCEKPMATTLADCERMVEAAKKSGKKLMIDQNQRLAGAHVKARELIEQGEIGSVITFATAFRHGGPETWSIDPGQSTWFFDKKRAAMGAMADLGVHKTDLIQYLIGQTVVKRWKRSSARSIRNFPTAAPSRWTTTPSASIAWTAARSAR